MRSPNKHKIIESTKKRPHLFILGAGATKATIPNGEEYTKRYIEGWWGNSRLTLKECTSFSMLRQLFEPLIVNEKNNNYNVI